MRPVGVEALENPLQRIVANPRSVIVDHDFNFRSHAAAGDADLAARFGERLGVDQKIGNHLSQPCIMARHRERVGSVSTAERSDVNGFFNSWATSAANISIASMRL